MEERRRQEAEKDMANQSNQKRHEKVSALFLRSATWPSCQNIFHDLLLISLGYILCAILRSCSHHTYHILVIVVLFQGSFADRFLKPQLFG